ncbi:G10 protein [Trypanosoma melophagium]|uniref:G10 protein n=1 Tax=Trypanosoma melophagium TaxID=715481 RepID=UPI00351A750A|nr:G10 protein [Trypanosoma melophagium]
MPKIRPGMKRPPPGFELISEKLDEYDVDMRLALSDDPTQAQIPLSKQSTKKSSSSNSVATPHDTEKRENTDEKASDHNTGDYEKPVPPLWRVARINRERTRYVYDACYREKLISSEVLNYCCEMNFVDAGLVRRWRLPGYERLCCTACCVPGTASAAARMVNKYANRHKTERRGRSDDENDGTCICRVPAEQRRNKRFTGCTVCGCTGCGSGEKRERDSLGERSETAKTTVAKVIRTENVLQE